MPPRTPTPAAAAQMAFEAAWDLLVRWRRGERPAADDYLSRWPAEVTARPEFADAVRSAEMRARLEAHPAGGEPAVDPTLVAAILDRLGVPPPASQDWTRYLTPPTRPGVVGCLGTKFQVLRLAGRGGMGVVFEADKLETNLEVRRRAVKVRLPDADTPTARERFLREANLQKDVQHESVVRVEDAGTVGTPAGPVDYIETEFVHGPTLQDLLDHFRRANSPVLVPLAVDLACQAAAGLAAAHGRRPAITHRDLTPRNLLMEWRGPAGRPAWRVRLCDFGLAREPGHGRLTRTGQLAGTPLYLAPEQVGPTGRPADERSDCFNLGLILYQLLTGKHPFAPDGLTLRVDLLQRCEPVWPAESNPSVPPRLADLMMNLLGPKADLRKPADEVRDLLARFDGRDLQPPATDRASARPRAAVAPAPSAKTDRPMRVYVSSLTPDVAAFRAEVAKALRAEPRRYEVVESPADRPSSAREVGAWLRTLKGCDAYVGVVGFCYGPVPAQGDVSLVEREYQEARAAGLVVWIGLPGKRRYVDDDVIDTDGTSVEAWRKELEAGGAVALTNPAEAASLVRDALAAHPWPPPEPPATGPDVWLDRYLAWVEEVHATLELPGVRGARKLALPLDQVYVALCGERTGAYELTQAQALLEDDLAAFTADFRDLPEPARRQLRAKLFRAKSPFMSAVWDRGQPRGEAPPAWTRTVSLAEAFREERWLVILGDPGSGKTTLGRWLAGRLARGYRAGGPGSPVLVPRHHVDPGRPYDPRLVDLGPARVPILVHAGDFAADVARAKAAGETLLLDEWLPRLTWKKAPPTWCGSRIPEGELKRLFQAAVADSRAVVVVDGLDEVGDEGNRRDVVKFVELFRGQLAAVVPSGAAGGNQLVVTSRIAGYHAAALLARPVTHVTVEPMGRPAVERFCENWVRAVHAATAPDQPAADREQAARSEAARLQAAVFDPVAPGIAEVASNPLLVTTLAMLFRDSAADQGLPKTRAELYQRVIELLVEGWRAVGLTADSALFVLAPLAAHVHETYQTGLIDGPELTDQVTRHLALYEGVPADPPPAGLADRVQKFVTLVRENVGLLAARGEDLYGFLHLTFQEYLAARHLLRTRDRAAAELAARAHDPRWRVPVLLALGYAAWRWPRKDASDLVLGFLRADDPLGPAVPRAALLCVDALADGGRFPTGLLAPVLDRLLAVYAARDVLARFPRLRTRVEDAAARLRRSCDRAAMDELLADAIRTPEAAGRAPATAALVRELGWFTPPVVAALASSSGNDSREWGWPIEQALRDLASPERPDVAPPRPKAPDAAVRAARENLRRFECREMLPETIALLKEAESRVSEQREVVSTAKRVLAESDAGRPGPEEGPTDPDETRAFQRRVEGQRRALTRAETELRKQITHFDHLTRRVADLRGTGQETLDELLRKLDAALAEQDRTGGDAFAAQLGRSRAAAGGHTRFQLRQTLRDRSPLPKSRPRRALESPELTARLEGDPAWLALFSAVYGGYADCRAVRTDREYWEFSRFLGRPDGQRELLIDADLDRYAGRFGGDDIVYNIAVFLENWNKHFGGLARLEVAFTASAVFRESPLDRLLVTALQDDVPPGELVEELRPVWISSADPAARLDALVALVALGEDGAELLEAGPVDAPGGAFLTRVLDRLTRAQEGIADAAYRSRAAVMAELATLDEPDPAVWVAVVDQVLGELAELAETPVLVPAALREQAPRDYRAALDADAFYYAANTADDPVVAATEVMKALAEADDPDWFRPFLVANRGPSRRRGKLPARWDVEPLPFRPRPADGTLPIHGLEALLAFDLDTAGPGPREQWIAGVIAKAARPLARHDQRLELAALAAGVGRVDLASELVPELGNGPDRDRLTTLETLAHDVAEPYWRARALLALARWAGPWGTDRLLLLAQAARAAADVGDPAHRFELLEVLLPLAGPEDTERLTAELKAAAAEVVDPDDGARALARTARLLSGVNHGTLWAGAFRSAGRIVDPDQRAETLQLLGGFAPRDPETLGAWEAAARSLATPTQRARAANRLARQFLRDRPASLQAKVAARPQLWTPLLVSASLREVLAHARGPDRAADVWQRLAADPADPGLVSELSLLGGEGGLRLTRRAADAVSAVVRANDHASSRLLLPLLHTPAPAAVPVVEGWTQHPDPFVAHHAVLILAEGRRVITVATAPALLSLHAGPFDRSRYRADLVLGSPFRDVGRDTLLLRASRLGADVLEAVAAADLATEATDPEYGFHYRHLACDVIHDDPDLVARWLEQGAGRGPAARRAAFLLRAVYSVGDAVWPVLLAGLTAPRPEVRLSTFKSVCQLAALTGRLPNGWRDSVVRALRTMDVSALDNVLVLAPVVQAVEQHGTYTTSHSLRDSAHLVVDVVLAMADANDADLVARLEDHLRRRAISVREVLTEPDDAILFKLLARLGNLSFFLSDGSDDGATSAADRIIQTPASLALLVRWLAAALSEGPNDAAWFPRTQALLRVTADAAARLPDAFSKVAAQLRLGPHLTAATHSSALYGRRAAVRLLGYLRSATPEVIESILEALKDRPLVQAAALEVTREFREANPAAVRRLTAALFDDSGVVALGAARILAALCRQQWLAPAARVEILDALAAATADRRSHRHVVLLSPGKDPLQIQSLGRLDQAFHAALLEATGVLDP